MVAAWFVELVQKLPSESPSITPPDSAPVCDPTSLDLYSQCSGHGKCIAEAEGPKCVCLVGFEGSKCETGISYINKYGEQDASVSNYVSSINTVLNLFL